MAIMNPLLYKYISTTSSSLASLPLDILQTRIVTNNQIIFDWNEFKWVLIFPIVLSSQNIIYNRLYFIKNIFIRGATSGILITPLYSYLEIYKIYDRIKALPNLNIFLKITILRQAIFFGILYKINFSNILYSDLISALVANIIGFPLKLYALNSSYSIFKINKKTIKIMTILELMKTSISDGLGLFLMNKY